MKKSKLIKLLVSALSLCLLIGAMVGITAMAEDEGSETTPYVLSKNVSYGDKLYLFYAVPTASFPEGATNPQLAVYDADGNFSYFVNPAETKTVFDEECYIFNSSGVAAKEINTVEKVIPCYTDAAGNVVYGEAKTYSVEDYLLQRLYKDGYALASDDYVPDGDTDGLQVERRTLYYSMLKYGATAQALLAPDAAVKIGSVGYVSAPDSFVTMNKNDGEYSDIYLNYDFSKALATKAFVGWKVSTFDKFGALVSEKNYANGSKVAMGNNFIIASPILVDTDDMTTESSKISAALKDSSTLTYDENGVTITDDQAANASSFSYTVAASTDSDVNVAIFEADATLSATKGNQIYFTQNGTQGSKTSSMIMFHASKKDENTNAFKWDAFGNNASKQSGISIPGNTKFRLRIEYYEASTVADLRWKVYVDGTLVYTGNDVWGTNYYSTTTPVQAENMNLFYIGYNNNSYGANTFNNMIITYAKLENTDPHANDLGKPGTYLVDDKIDFNNGIPTSYATTYGTDYGKYQLATDVNGEKVLNIVKTEKGSGGRVEYKLTKADEANANKVVLEYDIKASRAGQVSFYFNSCFLGLNTEGNYDSFWFSGNMTLGVLNSTKCPVNDWIHVKMEYTANETEKDDYAIDAKGGTGKLVAANAVITVTDKDGNVLVTGGYTGFLGRTTTSEGVTYYNEKQLLVSEVTSVRFSLNSSSLLDAYYKNIQLYKVYDASLDAAE